MTELEILEMFHEKRNKVEILWEALEYMQQYNGRTRIECIGLAMGLFQEEAYNEAE